MKKNKGNFIKTTDKNTAKQLRELGFAEVTETGSKTFTFVNNGKLTFENVDINKIIFSDKLFI